MRENFGGVLYSRVFGKAAAVHLDPVEKKPLFHFLPGAKTLSIAAVGCNFQCAFCQNHSISQHPRFGDDIPGDDVDSAAIVESCLSLGGSAISYTYTEPTVFFEWARDVGERARAAGLKNIFVSNGYMTPEAIDRATSFLDAANVDLKSFSDAFYRKYCSARLQPVLDSIQLLRSAGVFVELTTLLIPGVNDSEKELAEMAAFIASVNPDTPWHVSAFHPDYRMLDVPSTPAASLDRAVEAGDAAGLRFVYCGNVPGHPRESTLCPACGAVLIARTGFFVRAIRVGPDGLCPGCGCRIPLVLRPA